MASYKNQNTQLDEAIARLEIERDIKFDALKDQMDITLHSMKPIHILNGALEDIKEFPEVKSNIVQLVVSLAGGYLSKKLLLGKSNSTFKKILGSVIQYGVTNFVSKKVNSN
jgi:hypothetical protein